jgi:ethanolamine ammonia-lyase large subunit
VTLSLLQEALEATRSLKRGTVGDNVMYFETGQGSALSAGAHHGVDQQTLEARAYAVARKFEPLLVNTVVGFIGPEYLLSGKADHPRRAGGPFLRQAHGPAHGRGRLLHQPRRGRSGRHGRPPDPAGNAGCTFVMGVPGADDIMLNYQSTSFHDAAYLRKLLGRKPAPEFAAWLESSGIMDVAGGLVPIEKSNRLLALPDRVSGDK